jgi:cytoskeletal protein RodZ
VFTGPALRALRESRGVSLHDISERTKIGVGTLRSIEDESYDKLPAPVYVKAFVRQYAGILRVDADRASREYVDRMENRLR